MICTSWPRRRHSRVQPRRPADIGPRPLLGGEMTGNTDRSEGQIVVGVDGTVAATAAVRWAILEALLLEANLHLVFACDHDRLSRAPYAGRSGAPGPDGNNAAG